MGGLRFLDGQGTELVDNGSGTSGRPIPPALLVLFVCLPPLNPPPVGSRGQEGDSMCPECNGIGQLVNSNGATEAEKFLHVFSVQLEVR